MASTLAHTVLDKAEQFFPVFVEHAKANVITSMSDGLDKLKSDYPERHKEVSQKWREIIAAVEPHLATIAGGRKKRTTRRRKHKATK